MCLDSPLTISTIGIVKILEHAFHIFIIFEEKWCSMDKNETILVDASMFCVIKLYVTRNMK